MRSLPYDDDEQFELRVRDDGKGIDPAVLANQGIDGHYGLRSMPERAALIGGKLAVWSEVSAPERRWSCASLPAPSTRERRGAPGGHDCCPDDVGTSKASPGGRAPAFGAPPSAAFDSFESAAHKTSPSESGARVHAHSAYVRARESTSLSQQHRASDRCFLSDGRCLDLGPRQLPAVCRGPRTARSLHSERQRTP